MIEETFKVNPKSFAIFTSITICSVIILRWFFSKPAGARAGLRLPPSPIALPIIGHLHLLAPIPHQAFHKLSLRHGPLIFLRLGSVPCVVASSPETAKEFLKTHELFFADRPQSKAVGYLTYGSSDFSFAPFGAYWKFMKKLTMFQLLGGQTLDQLAFIRKEEVVRLLRKLETKAKEKTKVDLSGELIRMSNNVICRLTMSRRCSENEGEAEEVRKLVEETAELTGKFNLADYIGFCKNLDLQGFDKRLKDVRRRFDRMMEGILEEKKALQRDAATTTAALGGGPAVKDILDILLDIHDDENAVMKLSLENIKAYILDIFTAGTDTSALTIEWALAELMNNPGVLEKLREEIDAAVGKNRVISEADISNMPYLQAIVKETLRLHPTGPMTVRECTKDCEINGYTIQAKTTLFVNIWAIGRDPKHWKEPLKFMPERFMEESSNGIDLRGQHFHMIPFGSGRRVCPGASLALLVVQAGLGALVQCFDWEVDGGGGMVDMTEGPGLTLPRAKPLVCTPVLRLNPLPLLA